MTFETLIIMTIENLNIWQSLFLTVKNDTGLALSDTRLFKKMNNSVEWIKQHCFEWMIFWIWITLPGKNWIFFEWIFCHTKLNELLNEWKKCVIHRKNEYNVKKKDVKFDKRSGRVWKTDETVIWAYNVEKKTYKGPARAPILGR